MPSAVTCTEPGTVVCPVWLVVNPCKVAPPSIRVMVFVAMSTDRTFHYYAWDDLVRASGGKLRSLGVAPR